MNPYVDNGPDPYPPYHPPNEMVEPPLPPLRGSFSPSNYDAGLTSWPTGSWKRSAVLDASDPAAAICLAARRGDVPFLTSQRPKKLLLLDGNGDSVITHAVDSGNRRSLKYLLSLPFCVRKLLNVLSKDGNYPLRQAVTNDDLQCAVRLLQAGARIMVPVNHFEDCTVAPTSMLHEIIYSLAHLEDGGRNAEDRLMLATLLEDLLENPESKYCWAEQMGILLFRTIIGEDVTGTQMRTPLELAQFLGLHEAAQQLARVQNTLCTSLFHEHNPDRINFPLEFLRREVPLNALSLPSEPKVRYLADSLKSLCDLSRTTKPLKVAIDYLDALQKEAEEQNHGPRHDGGLLSHNNNNHHNLLLISRMKEVIQNAMHTG